MKYLLTVVALLIMMPRTTAQDHMNNTFTKTISIKANPTTVWEYVNDLSKWPKWAIHNVTSSRKGENGFWLMEGPRGVSRVQMNSDQSKGILDHDFIDPSEGHWIVYSRVVPGAGGAHFMITFTKPDPMPHDAFETGMRNLEEELQQLKKVIESRTEGK